LVQERTSDWSIITKTVQLANKAVVTKGIVKDATGRVIATAGKKETEISFLDYIEKAETEADMRARRVNKSFSIYNWIVSLETITSPELALLRSDFQYPQLDRIT
jgi:hypothetical protein